MHILTLKRNAFRSTGKIDVVDKVVKSDELLQKRDPIRKQTKIKVISTKKKVSTKYSYWNKIGDGKVNNSLMTVWAER